MFSMSELGTKQNSNLVSDGEDNVEQRQCVFWVSHSGSVPRNVDVETFTRTAADEVKIGVRFTRKERSGIEAVQRDVKNPRIIVEHVLQNNKKDLC